MALHSRDAVIISAAVATRSRADCSSMEGHSSLSTSLVINSRVHIRITFRITWAEDRIMGILPLNYTITDLYQEPIEMDHCKLNCTNVNLMYNRQMNCNHCQRNCIISNFILSMPIELANCKLNYNYCQRNFIITNYTVSMPIELYNWQSTRVIANWIISLVNKPMKWFIGNQTVSMPTELHQW